MIVLHATAENIELAGAAIRNGALVIMPTETVYGLAANALDDVSVDGAFRAKGRPPENPLIVHIARMDDINQLVSNWPKLAARLASEFWPGPLTLVLPKAAAVPMITTGGLNTVAIRMPDHPVALGLIRASGCPLAAPSANRFMGLSPTQVQHIDPSLASHVAYALDGGPCKVGLESTVLDLTSDTPRILRPGGITREQIEQCLGRTVEVSQGKERRAPGMYPRHYAPKARVTLTGELGEKPGLTFGRPATGLQIHMSREPEAYARRLYSALHELDEMGLEAIYVEKPPDTDGWSAVWDRLEKASAQLD